MLVSVVAVDEFKEMDVLAAVASLERGSEPMIASAAMSLSSVSVVGNALRLRRVSL